MRRIFPLIVCLSLSWLFPPTVSNAWFDETHVALAKAAGYPKWFNSCGPDMIRVKMGNREGHNHFVNNPRGTLITPQVILRQVGKYNNVDSLGHLYGSVMRSVRDYLKAKRDGKYAEYHLAFCAHYASDLYQPLHNIEHTPVNRKHHRDVDGIINREILDNLANIKIYPSKVESEEDLIREIARIANLSMMVAYYLQGEKRLLTTDEAYVQVGHSASLFRAILTYVRN